MSIILLFASGSGCVRSFEEESYYNIKDMDISADLAGTSFVDLNVTTYVEKYQGDTEKNASLLLKVYSRESGLLEVQEEVKLGKLKKGETKAVSQSLSLPKTGGYNIRSVLFEEDTQKGSGEINVYNLDFLPADVQDIGLEISEMDFRVRKVEDRKVLIESDIYLTNEGKKTSQDLRMLVKVREMDAGLLADKVWIRTGKIKPETTVIRSVNLTMPDQYNYVVEVLIWNNDTIVRRGEDYIQLNPEVEVKDQTSTKTKEIQTSEFEIVDENEMVPEEEYAEEESTPGFSLFLSAVLLCSAVVLRRRFG
ncbi:hypothetical protein EO98_03845 [Methanosarcina sp. 2.H.T.1A.6]|nr:MULTISPECIES: hypothetical protein [unclassified Methanosarcina]KKG14881.1 hypothetical protein EO97_07120 [Methanosarcina sp. 2.H.T.1A.15]KKG19046.1 hypothetical protein EO94_06485 [Methanosarcina sp. 2.H.T.1A.3]KKG20854.1 hypothetical protein EO98_03845 [Methanosarcina sp. 2.H.T.1A.6]KKG22251.1 hypothetical protein EO96_06790 [Methanosarcina sp. 2.H.T.1A.8]